MKDQKSKHFNAIHTYNQKVYGKDENKGKFDSHSNSILKKKPYPHTTYILGLILVTLVSVMLDICRNH